MADKQSNKVMLVYQAGIANVFRVNAFNMSDYGRDATRLLQGTFEQAVYFVRGCAAVGAVVRSAHCNQAGDIATAHWSEDLDDAPFDPVNIKLN